MELLLLAGLVIGHVFHAGAKEGVFEQPVKVALVETYEFEKKAATQEIAYQTEKAADLQKKLDELSK